MTSTDRQGITYEERNRQLNVIMDQQRELVDQDKTGTTAMLVTVTCPCGRCRGITRAVRCLYCDIWYCELCAEGHFGQTRAEHREQHPVLGPPTTGSDT